MRSLIMQSLRFTPVCQCPIIQKRFSRKFNSISQRRATMVPAAGDDWRGLVQRAEHDHCHENSFITEN
jgi:hypothetical protein